MVKPATAGPALTDRGRGYLLAVVGTTIWSTTGPMIAFLLAASTITPLVLAAWRDLFAALFLGLVLAWRAPSRFHLARKDWLFCFIYGAALAAMNASWTVSVARNGAAVSTVLVYTAPALVALASRWLFHEKLSRVIGLALVLALVGVTLVAGLYDPLLLARDPFGVLVGIGSGVVFSLYSLFGKAAARRRLPTTTVMFYTFGIAGVLLFISQWSQAIPQVEPRIWLGLLILAAGPTLGGYGLYTASLRHLPAATASLITTIEPAQTALIAWVFLGETLTMPQLIGSALILAGVLSLSLNKD